MCLILFAHDIHSAFRLVLAANRDEMYDRPTDAAAPWAVRPDLLAGRDLMGGGTWLGVTAEGRWAAVTNFRDATAPVPDPTTRGVLVSGFLMGGSDPRSYSEDLRDRTGHFNGFNLLVGSPEGVVWSTNRAREGPTWISRSLSPGIYGISNDRLDEPWPKVVRGKSELRTLLDRPASIRPEALFGILLDQSFAQDNELPSTGVPPELERQLSATFIRTAGYGTRSSSALLIGRDGSIWFAERRFDSRGEAIGERSYALDKAAGRWIPG